MSLFSLTDLEAAIPIVRRFVPPTPAYAWPLLRKRIGVEVIVKHENHTPTGSFKARGGLVYVDSLKQMGQLPAGLVTATRGNHGQSIALAASLNGIPSIVVVPKGNSVEKNEAMEAFGAKLLIAGDDFDESRAVAAKIAQEQGFQLVPAFHPTLVKGVATYALELFRSIEKLDVVYVPIGMGSGICGLITVRDLLNLDTEIVGVVAKNAPAFALSVKAGKPVSTKTAKTFADGMACREPQAEPLEIIAKGSSRIVQVSDDEIAGAMRAYYSDTHNLAEGAGAAPLAALIQEKDRYFGRRAGLILCGGNIDRPVFQQVLAGETPIVP